MTTQDPESPESPTANALVPEHVIPLPQTVPMEDGDQKVHYSLYNLDDGDKVLNCYAPKLIPIYYSESSESGSYPSSCLASTRCFTSSLFTPSPPYLCAENNLIQVGPKTFLTSEEFQSNINLKLKDYNSYGKKSKRKNKKKSKCRKLIYIAKHLSKAMYVMNG